MYGTFCSSCLISPAFSISPDFRRRFRHTRRIHRMLPQHFQAPSFAAQLSSSSSDSSSDSSEGADGASDAGDPFEDVDEGQVYAFKVRRDARQEEGSQSLDGQRRVESLQRRVVRCGARALALLRDPRVCEVRCPRVTAPQAGPGLQPPLPPRCRGVQVRCFTCPAHAHAPPASMHACGVLSLAFAAADVWYTCV